MNSKNYRDEMKQKQIERELQEKEKVLLSIRKLQEGKNVNVNDLEKVKEYIKVQYSIDKQGIDLNYLAVELNDEVEKKRKEVAKDKDLSRRKRLNQERLKRLRRIHQNEKHKEKELEF